MANEVSKATKNYLEKYGEAASQRGIIGRLLKFNKFGEYVAGKEEEKIPRGTRLAAYMPSLAVGWVRWEDNGRAEVLMGPIAEEFVPKRRSELGCLDSTQWPCDDEGKRKDPWQFRNEFVSVDLEDEELFTFSTASKGGLGAIGELSKAYGKHIRLKPNEVPIVELDVGSYRHSNPEYGEIRYPIFKVVGWISLDKLPPIDGARVSGGDDEGGGELGLASPEPEAAPQPAKPVKPTGHKF